MPIRTSTPTRFPGSALPAYPRWQELPPAVREVALPFWWDLDRLHALPLATTTVAVPELLWHLELPVWSHGGAKCRLTPRQVAAEPDRYPQHWARVLAGEVDVPVTIRGDTARPVLIDGYHRLLKAALAGLGELPGLVLPHGLWPAIAHQVGQPDVLAEVAN